VTGTGDDDSGASEIHGVIVPGLASSKPRVSRLIGEQVPSGRQDRRVEGTRS
jgi:hypothetical protein